MGNNVDARVEHPREPIAIIGIGCRFPGNANNPAAFWTLLRAGVDAITEVPADRWNIAAHYHPEPGTPGKTYSRWGGFLHSIDQFEPEGFGISPREAAYMDPQQRLLLEVAWEALEDGGQVVEQLAGTRTGVFVGISTSDYSHIQSSPFERGPVDAHAATGGALSIAAGRISYCLNLQGPSLAVDTACSSSLVATHLACQSLWNHESDLVLAGGVNIIIAPDTFVGFCAASMLSPDGRCKAFDSSANGFVRGEGAGMVLLKPLSRALADGDPVYAVILASSVNQDGRTAGIAMPSPSAQAALLREVYRQAGIAPHQVHYIETHGTGTAVGDPIEARAIGMVLAAGRSATQAGVLGSVKTNIGHLEAAAGIAGLIKTALVLKHRMIPPNLHFHTPNPVIPFDDLHLRVPTALEPWPEAATPAVASVNSFGFGGTNAHVVLREYRPEPAARTDMGRADAPVARLLPLSARTPAALQALAQSYRDFLRQNDTIALADLCYTASMRRTHFEHRASLVASSRDMCIEHLEALVKGERRSGMFRGRRVHGRTPKLVGVFAGQGPQWWGMGRELLDAEPVFHEAIEACDALLQQHADWSLLEELTADEARSRLQETAIAQPAIFALQVALTALWQSWGVTFDAVVGHSVGEIAAAHVAGALGLEEAVRVIYQRGRCMELASSQGKMLAVGLSVPEARQAIQGYHDAIALAAVNSPTSATLSGDPVALQELARSLEEQGVYCQFLRVSYAFHSAQMDPVHDELLASLRGLAAHAPAIPMVSTVTGASVDGQVLDAHYWWQNVRQTVCFAPAVDRLIDQGYDVFVEVSPHPVLSGAVAQCLAHRGLPGTVLPSLRRHEEERATMLASLGGLYTLGYPVDWQRSWPAGGRCVHLPTYPWQRQSYWHESPSLREERLGGGAHPLLGRARASADPSWESAVDPRLLPYLADHRVHRQVVFPAAAYVEMARAVAQEHLGTVPCILEDVQFHKALFLPENGTPPTVQTVCYPADASFAVHSRTSPADPAWTLHTTGSIRPMSERSSVPRIDLTALKQTLPEEVRAETCYTRLADMGLHFGPAFRGIERLWRTDGIALGEIRLREHLALECARYGFHPALLDSCLQVLSGALLPGHDAGGLRLYLPVRIERIRFYHHPPHQVWSCARLTQSSAQAIVGDIQVYDAEGTLVLDVTGLRCQAVEWMPGAATDKLEHWLYEVTWRHKPRPEQPPSPRSAADLPRPRALAAAVTSEIQQLDALRGWSTRLSEARVPLDRLATVYILRALRELGWRCEVGDRLSVESLTTQLAVAPQHQRLLRRFIQILAQADYLSGCGTDTWEVQRVPPQQDADALWRETLWRHPAFLAELDLLATCGAQLAAMLRGDIDPLQSLFPNGSTTAAEHLFQDAPSSLPYNVMVQKVVQQLLRQLPPHRPLRVLEIGGGTGGLTSYVLPELPAHCTDYVFSDISQFFLTRAGKKFQDAACMRFQLLDIEHDPLQQGYAPHAFDLILAFDVLHATRDLRATLGHVEQLLASEGLLLLVEIEHPGLWLDVVFGTSDGWWRFRDPDLRSDYPLLTRDAWQTLLEARKWTEVVPLALPSEPGDSAQVVLLARGPSVPDVTPCSASVAAPPHPEGTPGSWLIFADRGGTATAIASRLRSRGDTCSIVTAGDGFERLDRDRFQVSPSRPEDMDRLLQTVTTPGNAPWRGMMHLWSLDAPPPEATTTESLQQAEALGCHCVMHFAQALYRLEGLPDKPLLLLVTRGAQPLGEIPVAIGQAPLVGLGRTIIHEYPDWRCKLLDLEPHPTPQEIDHLLAELWTADADEEIVYRHGTRFVPRLEPARPVTTSVSYTAAASVTTTPYRAEPPASGVLTNVVLRAATLHPPEPGQVEIAVAAAALNFRDVMRALGLLPSEGNQGLVLGDECAGTVVAVGEGVDHVQVGEDVIALASGSFGSHVTTAAPLVIPKPGHLTFAEAVTMPTVFLTAYYALHHLARIRAGERLLIHAAAGGVGLAAVQIAQHAGAEIFATAGSPEKRAFLTRLGVEHVMDSRSLTFFDQIMERTNGKGVDIVLNSLAGQALTRSIACLAPHGRFLELGKRDIYQNSKVGLWPFRKNIAFFGIDLGPVVVEKPALFRTMLDELCQYIDAHTVHPLPHRVFPVTRLAEALRYMAQGRHVGKVVVTMQDHHVPVQSRVEPVTFRPDATYLITGGLGGFGLVLAQWIIARGGRHLVLVGRSGAASSDAKRAVAALRGTGAQVEIAAADVTSGPQVAEVLAHIDRTMPPLRGVFHAAMGIDDDLLVRLDAQRFRQATAAKIEGAWNLHTQTRQHPLEHFVLFSSFASLVGNPGQANYTAANTFLDALAAHRRCLGLPGIAMNWGQLTEVGYVAQHPEVADYFERVGITGFAPSQAMAALERLLPQQPVQMGVLRIDWHRWAQLISRGKLAQRLSPLIGPRGGEARGEENGYLREALLHARPEDRPELIHTYVQQQVARVLGTAATAVDDDRPLSELGLDSLMAIELKNRLESDLAVALPMRELIQTPTINRISAAALRLLDGPAAGTADRAAPVVTLRGAMSPASSCLVPLQPRGIRPPLFCLHPVGGQVNIYRPLVEALPADQPVYGLQSRLLTGAGEEHRSVEEMALAYAQLIRQRQPHGPYFLLGFSFGGFLAMAVADVLEHQEQRVAFVGLVDCNLQLTSATYPHHRAMESMIASIYELLQRALAGLPALTAPALSELATTILASATEQRTDVTLKWLSERHVIGDDMPLASIRDYLDGFFTRFESHIKLIPHFQPAVIRAPLFVWWAQEELSRDHGGQHQWHRQTSATVEEMAVPGSHYAVMLDPSVATLARQLVQHLHATQAIQTAAPHAQA